MSHRLNIIFILLTTFCLPQLVFAQSTSATTYYGAYSHAPQGSTRAMGLGGAYTGLSDDASGIIYNPAGLAFGPWNIDIGSTDNLTINRETDIDDDGKRDGIPYQFQFKAIALKWERVAVAFGQSSPYSAQINGTKDKRTEARLDIKSLNYLLAVGVTEEIAIGATYRQLTMFQNYNFDNSAGFMDPTYAEDTENKTSYTVGISYRPDKRIGFGMTYTPTTIFEGDPDRNAEISSPTPIGGTEATWFKGSVIPEKVSFGGFFKASDRLMYIADLDYVRPPKSLVYLESPFDGNLSKNKAIKSFPVIVVHGGIEYQVVKEKKRGVIWRAGGYREPARVVGGADRLHLTMGVEVSLGPLVVSAAMDESKDFTNSTQSIGISLGE